MTSTSCAKCKAEIIPGTSFCRSCGAPVESQPEPSEGTTALLEERVPSPITQRLEPRTTSETNEAAAVRAYRPASPAGSSAQAAPFPASRHRLVMVVLVLLLLLGAVGGLIGVKRARLRTNKVLINQRYTYPGARTVVNLGDAGGAVLQMETPDRIDKVSEWYISNFNPAKVMRVPPATAILRDDTVNITLVGSDEGTSIVIKQGAP